jgi:SNF2 family DNA or RNA helicase
LENHLGELWAQFDFLLPGLLGTRTEFQKNFRHTIEKRRDPSAQQRLNRRIAPFLLRRSKDQVLSELPPKTESTKYIELSGRQRELYELIRLDSIGKLNAAGTAGGGAARIMVLDALTRLRQVCCDPRLLPIESGRSSLEVSAKLELLLEMITELLREGRRILLFSQFTSMLALIEEALKSRRIKYLQLTGETRDRAAPVEAFQRGDAAIFLLSLKAGGVGINLTAADTVIHYDPWWNPAVEEQATDRAWRIGQDKPVFVYKLIAQDTVEEKIQALKERKRELLDAIFEGASSEPITEAELRALLD